MKILMCSDGSEQADRAVRLGAAIAVGTAAEVTLFGIIETPAKSKLILDSLQRWQAAFAGKKIPIEVVTRPGDPIAEIVNRTEADKYDLVIVGAVRKETHGLFWMSSKAYKIIKEVTPPVLSVAGESTTIQRALICSGGKYSENAVQVTAKLAVALGASVTLLHVREIHTGKYDLVVTGSAPSRSLRTYVLGDISREIVNHSECPVLVVRTQEKLSKARQRFRKWWGPPAGKGVAGSGTQ
jgi:nucleotide-binding universal stress UspA family protein